MKKIFAISIVLFLFTPTLVSAQDFPKPYDRYVNDFAGFLDATSISQLHAILSSLEQNTTAEVVVVTVETTNPLPPSQYRTELFDNWNIGKEEKDNGLLILYAVKERRIEVETGYGLEGVLPDSRIGRILDEFYVPSRDANQIVRGIVLATEEIARIINENADEVGTWGRQISFEWQITSFLVLIVFLSPFFLILLISYLMRHPKCEQCGERMRFYETEGNYDIFTCKNGHRMKRKKRRYGKFIIFGMGGGLGGGSGSGGGFGGGSSGGGGVGR